MTSMPRRERQALADLMDALGPDAPTLCEGWTTRDLAAHLVVRESSPAALGIAVRQLSGWTRHAQQAKAQSPFESLVQQVRSGPPRWSPMRVGPVDHAVNALEFFVHHEDVRRAQPGWQPRMLAPEDDAELWGLLGSRAHLFLRNTQVGVVLLTPDGRRLAVKDQETSVTLSGEPGELVLYLHGRKDHALVDLQGAAGSVATFRRTRLRV